MNPSELISEIENKLTNLSNEVQQTGEIYKMGTFAEEVLKERAVSPNSIPGLEVGWNKFDYYTNGGQPAI